MSAFRGTNTRWIQDGSCHLSPTFSGSWSISKEPERPTEVPWGDTGAEDESAEGKVSPEQTKRKQVLLEDAFLKWSHKIGRKFGRVKPRPEEKSKINDLWAKGREVVWV